MSPRGLQWKGSWSQAPGQPCLLGQQVEAASRAARMRKAEEEFDRQLEISREGSLMRVRGQLLHPVAALPAKHEHVSSAVVRDGFGSRLETKQKPVLDSLLLG